MIRPNCIFAVFWFVIGICAAVTAAEGSPESGQQDHLVPIKGYVDASYEALLRRKLFVTPANYGRIVTLASAASVGESSISLYSKPNVSVDATFVTLTQAQRNLWYAENGEDPAFPRAEIKVERRDATFPRHLAEAISAAVKDMLAATRPGSAKGRVIVDPINIEVFLEQAGEISRRGLLIPDAIGPRTSSFRALLRSLEAYCQAPAPRRSEWLVKIEANVKNIRRDHRP